MNKKIFLGFVAMILIIISNIITVLGTNTISVFVDSKSIYMDVSPQIINGRTMVPLRAVTEAVGCKVDWDSETKQIIVYMPGGGGGSSLSMFIDDPVVGISIESGIDGRITNDFITIDAPPVMINNRTMVPLRFIAETIGFTVDWDQNTQTVYIYSLNYEDPNQGNWNSYQSDKGDTSEIKWWGVFEGDEYYIEISEYNSINFKFDVRSSSTGRSIKSGIATITKDDVLFALGDDFGFYLYEDFNAIDIMDSESSEWAFLRGHYIRL